MKPFFCERGFQEKLPATRGVIINKRNMLFGLGRGDERDGEYGYADCTGNRKCPYNLHSLTLPEKVYFSSVTPHLRHILLKANRLEVTDG